MGLLNQGHSKANGNFLLFQTFSLHPHSFQLLTVSLPEENRYHYEILPTTNADSEQGNRGENANISAPFSFVRWLSTDDGLGLDTVAKRRAVFAVVFLLGVILFICRVLATDGPLKVYCTPWTRRYFRFSLRLIIPTVVNTTPLDQRVNNTAGDVAEGVTSKLSRLLANLCSPMLINSLQRRFPGADDG